MSSTVLTRPHVGVARGADASTDSLSPRARSGEHFMERLEAFSERFVEIERQRSALDAAHDRLLAEAAAFADLMVDSVVPFGTPPAEGRALARRSVCATLAMATRIPEQSVQRRIGEAEALVLTAPDALDALEAGRISATHARVITDQLRDVPAEARQTFLAQVIAVAEATTASRLKQRARVIRERMHPDSICVRATRAESDRRVELEPAADGMSWIHLFTTASIAQATIERLDAVAAEARAAGDDRTLAQLRADALGSLTISGVTEHADGESHLLARPIAVEARIHATVQVTVPVMTLLGHADTPGTLDGYGPVAPDTASRLAATAPSMIRVLTHPETGAVLSVGRDRYRVSADLQRVVRLRDTTCRAPGCNRRARACDLDHTVAWDSGGTTDVGNLACLCRHHHRLKHLSGWNLTHGPDGSLTWTTPDGRTHRTEADPPY